MHELPMSEGDAGLEDGWTGRRDSVKAALVYEMALRSHSRNNVPMG